MLGLLKSKSKASSRQQIAIEGVRDGVLILPRGEYRTVLQVSPVNFELRSDEEQDAIVDTYESFLNSVGTNLQILIRTREMDMDAYLKDIEDRTKKESVPIYRAQLENYNEFIRSLISGNKILTRHFYIVIPYKATAKGDFELASEQMKVKIDIVSRGIGRLGMQTRRLSSLEILDLFYSFYSPSQSKIQPFSEKTLEIIHTTLTGKEA